VATLKTFNRVLLVNVAAATCFFSVSICLAADVSVVGAMPFKAPPIANYDWSGLYFGGNVGYGRGYGRNTLFDPNPTAADSSFGSLFGGMQFGYNYRLPSRLLVGIEGDFSFPNYLDDGIVASRSTPASFVTEKLDFVSTLRARAGYAFDHWLFYATGGSPGRKRVSWRILIRPVIRTRFCECARAGL
jgi:opacity protein-like surface antigen